MSKVVRIENPPYVVAAQEACRQEMLADGWYLDRYEELRLHGVIPAIIAEYHHSAVGFENWWFEVYLWVETPPNKVNHPVGYAYGTGWLETFKKAYWHFKFDRPYSAETTGRHTLDRLPNLPGWAQSPLRNDIGTP